MDQSFDFYPGLPPGVKGVSFQLNILHPITFGALFSGKIFVILHGQVRGIIHLFNYVQCYPKGFFAL